MMTTLLSTKIKITINQYLVAKFIEYVFLLTKIDRK